LASPLSDIWALFTEVGYAWSEGDLTNGKKLNIIPVIPSVKRFNIPDLIFGSTIVAMGTSMPEFSFDVQSALAGNTDLALYN
jgi:hypothetical protein